MSTLPEPVAPRAGAQPGTPAFTVLLGVIISLQLFGISVTLPALPAITEALGGGAEGAQLTISAYLAGAASVQLVYGALSDRFGRRPVLLGGLALYGLAGVGCTLAPGIGLLIVLRALQGMGAAAGVVIARAVIRDLFEGLAAVRMLSVLGAITSLVPLGAPLAGGWLLAGAGALGAHEPWRVVYGTVAAGSLLTLLATAWLLRESIRRKDATATDPRRLLANGWRFVRTPGCLALAATSTFGMGAIFAYSATSSFVLIKVFGVSSSAYGWFLAMTGSAMLAGSLASTRMARRWPVQRTLDRFTALAFAAALVLLAGSYSGLRGTAGITLLMGPMLVVGFSMGLIAANATAAALQPVPQIAGVAAAVVGTLQMGSAAVFVWLGGRLFDDTPTALALCVALGCTISIVSYRLAARSHLGGDGAGTDRPAG